MLKQSGLPTCSTTLVLSLLESLSHTHTIHHPPLVQSSHMIFLKHTWVGTWKKWSSTWFKTFCEAFIITLCFKTPSMWEVSKFETIKNTKIIKGEMFLSYLPTFLCWQLAYLYIFLFYDSLKRLSISSHPGLKKYYLSSSVSGLDQISSNFLLSHFVFELNGALVNVGCQK